MSFDVCTFNVRRTVETPAGKREFEAVRRCWPAPIALVRTEVAREFDFGRSNYGEDKAFADWITKTRVPDETGVLRKRFRVGHLGRVLYHAHYRPRKKEFGYAVHRHPTFRIDHEL